MKLHDIHSVILQSDNVYHVVLWSDNPVGIGPNPVTRVIPKIAFWDHWIGGDTPLSLQYARSVLPGAESVHDLLWVQLDQEVWANNLQP